MIKCPRCGKKFNPMEAKIQKAGKKRMVQCTTPNCLEWIVYATSR